MGSLCLLPAKRHFRQVPPVRICRPQRMSRRTLRPVLLPASWGALESAVLAASGTKSKLLHRRRTTAPTARNKLQPRPYLWNRRRKCRDFLRQPSIQGSLPFRLDSPRFNRNNFSPSRVFVGWFAPWPRRYNAAAMSQLQCGLRARSPGWA